MSARGLRSLQHSTRTLMLMVSGYIAGIPAVVTPLVIAFYMVAGLYRASKSEAGFTEASFHEQVLRLPFLLPSAFFWVPAAALIYIATQHRRLPLEVVERFFPFYFAFVCLMDLIWGVGYAAALSLYPGFPVDTFVALAVIALAGVALFICDARVTWRRLVNGRWAEIVEAMK